jgi:hypothetical protein
MHNEVLAVVAAEQVRRWSLRRWSRCWAGCSRTLVKAVLVEVVEWLDEWGGEWWAGARRADFVAGYSLKISDHFATTSRPLGSHRATTAAQVSSASQRSDRPPTDHFATTSRPLGSHIARDPYETEIEIETPCQTGQGQPDLFSSQPDPDSRPAPKSSPKNTSAEALGAPSWLSKRKAGRAGRGKLFKALLGVLQAVKGVPPNPKRCKSEGQLLLSHWVDTRDGYDHDPEAWAQDLKLVAKWAQESPDPGAAREIRAEGWDGGTNRSRSVANISRRTPPPRSSGLTWEERLQAARAWESQATAASTIEAQPWLERSWAPPWPTQSPYDAEDFIEAQRWQIDAVRGQIREAGGGWRELAAWLESRVTAPEIVLKALKAEKETAA